MKFRAILGESTGGKIQRTFKLKSFSTAVDFDAHLDVVSLDLDLAASV